ncbi:MAG: hypothetical protein GC190_21065 [Alphaproteobacteria bacterium]|nr:hypothetical protein [Alphaproteobacteria bacterium]
MKALSWVVLPLSLAFFGITGAASADVERVTVHSGEPSPSRVSRITTDVELLPPFGRAKLIADLNPVNKDLLRLALEYGGRIHVVEHPKLHSTPRIYAQGIVILNAREDVRGQQVNSVYLYIPYVAQPGGDVCSYEYLKLILRPDDTIREQ